MVLLGVGAEQRFHSDGGAEMKWLAAICLGAMIVCCLFAAAYHAVQSWMR